MKRLNAILVLAALVACFSSCKKDPDNVQHGQIWIEENIDDRLFVNDNGRISVDLAGEYAYSGTVKKIAVKVGFKEDLFDAISVLAGFNGGTFTATIPGLTLDTTFYYQYVVYRYSDEFEQEMACKDDRVYTLSTHDLHFPVVTTKDISFVSNTTAMGCGIVSSENNDIEECGFCWGTHSKPKTTDNYDNNAIGDEEMFVQMSGLTSGTTYYARAYAKNSIGITYAGNEVRFDTKSSSLTVGTLDPKDITESSATIGIKVSHPSSSSYYGLYFGYLLGTTPRTNTCLSSFIPTDIPVAFTSNYVVSGLDYSTLYYCRTYVVDNRDTIFGEMKTFTTKFSSYEPTGELNGAFSVSPTQQVEFSPGNLQYQASTNKWRFAHQQWEYIGENNKNLSATYYGWIDLFGWGTSGHDHGAVCYQPWSSNSSYSNYYAYGSVDYNLNDQTGLADWGSNTIYLGEEATEGWRTLTSGEWDYLLNSRITPSGMRYAKAQLNVVNGTNNTPINGIIVFPDDWNDNGLIYRPNTPEASYTSNIIFVSDVSGAGGWKEEYESKGAVFLPAAGRRSGSWYYEDDQKCGYYWSASKYDSRISHPYFYEDGFGVNYLSFRYYGYSVRLVRNED